MTTYNFTSLGYPAPAVHQRQIQSKSGFLESSLTGAIQIIKRPTYWTVNATWNVYDGKFRKDLLAFLLSIEKTEHLLQLPYWGHVQRGAFGGTAVVGAASQTGRTIVLASAAINVTNWIRIGDWIRFGSSSSQGYMAAANANSGGTGAVTVTLTQDVLQSPVAAEAVSTSASSASLIACRCIQVSQWQDERTANTDLFTQISAQFVQDVLTR